MTTAGELILSSAQAPGAESSFEDLERMTMFATHPQGDLQSQGGGAPWMPTVDVSRKGDQIVVRADLPGMVPDEVRVIDYPDPRYDRPS